MQDPRFDAFKIPGLGDSVYYVSEFISEPEEDHLVNKISHSPLPKWQTVPTGRRLQYWGGTLTKSNALIPEPLPPFFTSFPNLVERVQMTGAFEGSKSGVSNQVLVNEYLPGQGIDPHTDGPAYFPATATISLLWPVILWLHPPNASPPADAADDDDDPSKPSSSSLSTDEPPAPIPIVLEPRSLLLVTSDVYMSWKHEILHAESDDFDAVRGRCANASLLGGARLKALVQPLREGELAGGATGGEGHLKREKRLSVTLRAVEKVVKGLSIGGRRV